MADRLFKLTSKFKPTGDQPEAVDARDLVAEMTREMLEAADKLEFERAAFLRDQIKKLKANGPQPADGKRGKKK